jgi:hypothetical protein
VTDFVSEDGDTRHKSLTLSQGMHHRSEGTRPSVRGPRAADTIGVNGQHHNHERIDDDVARGRRIRTSANGSHEPDGTGFTAR